jgi:hypothetical protein
LTRKRESFDLFFVQVKEGGVCGCEWWGRSTEDHQPMGGAFTGEIIVLERFHNVSERNSLTSESISEFRTSFEMSLSILTRVCKWSEESWETLQKNSEHSFEHIRPKLLNDTSE